MFKDAFTKLDHGQAARMIDLINPKLDAPFAADTCSVMVHDLSFYPGYFLTELTRHDRHPPVMRVAVCNEAGDVHILNWTKEAIFALNKSVPIKLTEESMPEYVRFFFTYVRGAHGRFLIIDTVDDIDWREEPAPAGRKALGRMIEPMRLKTKLPDGTHVYAVCIIFRDSLFQGEAYLRPDGMLSLHNEELLVEDIPVADDLFGQ